MKAITIKCFWKNIIDYNASNDSEEKISTKEIRMKKLKCINSYMKNKRIARNIRNKRNICFPGFASSLLKYKSFLSLGLECPIYQNIRIFYGVGFFIFGAREVPS